MSNRLILAGIATEILLIALIVYTPWGRALFGTASIALVVWLFIIPFALGMVVLANIRTRRRNHCIRSRLSVNASAPL